MNNSVRDDLQWMVVIPAYNEQSTIAELLQAVIKQHPTLIVVVNDASTDQTADILAAMDENHHFEVINNSRNLGKAGSLWRGFKLAIEKKIDVVVTLDGDGQHRPEDIPALLQKHLEHPQRIIIGARKRDLKTQPLSRYLANRFADFWISWASGYGVKDSQSGFRLYPVNVLEKLQTLDTREGFVFESEAIIEAAWQGHYVSVVTIPAIYHKNRRASHFKPWDDIKKITKMVASRLIKKRLNLKDLISALTNKAAPSETNH